MMYDNYLDKIALRFKTYLDAIEAEANFEHGPEFEIAICKTLRRALPSKYGICRGYLVDAEGNKAGDDVIIYDQERFPALRLIDNDDYSQKQKIPIEAAYAYIEAKNSLVLSGEDETFEKAITQVREAKSLVATREAIDVTTALDPYIVLTHLRPVIRPYWPRNFNPFFTAIIAKYVREKKGSQPLEADDVIAELNRREIPDDFPLDLLIAGDDIVGLPFVHHDDEDIESYHSPFTVPESHIRLDKCPRLAFAVGYCSLAYALDTIRLGRLPWPEIISDAIGVELTT